MSKRIVKRKRRNPIIGLFKVIRVVALIGLIIYGGHTAYTYIDNFINQSEAEIIDDPEKCMVSVCNEYTVSPETFVSDTVKDRILDDFNAKVKKTQKYVDWNDLTKPSGLHVDEIRKILPESLKEYSELVYMAERDSQYPINAIFIISLMRQESAGGTSNIALSKNNLFGLGAYDHDTDNAFTFESKAECIQYLCKLLHTEYFTDNKSKALPIVNKTYCSRQNWCSSIMKMGNDLNDTAILIFDDPADK